MTNNRVMRVAPVRLLVERWGIVGVLVYSTALVIFRVCLLEFPVVLLDADRKFEIFACDGVPVLCTC